MTRAAPEAPPLALREERPGVGRPPPAKPRPGLEPAPRPTTCAALAKAVWGQARDGFFPLLLTLLLTTQAAAQIVPTGSPAADILLSQAIAEHRTFLTCSALDPATHQQILADWQKDTAAAEAILTSHDVPPDSITAFRTAADPAALMPGPDTPWADVKILCETRPDWRQTYSASNLTILELKLPEAFQ